MATQDANTLRTKAQAEELKREESFQRSDTDGFLSQWAHGLEAQRLRMAAEVAENDGQAEFPALFLLNGERAPAKLIYGRYGPCWAFCDANGAFTGKFIKAFPERETTMTKKGYREGYEWAPAVAEITGSGTGLSGSAWARIRRTDRGF